MIKKVRSQLLSGLTVSDKTGSPALPAEQAQVTIPPPTLPSKEGTASPAANTMFLQRLTQSLSKTKRRLATQLSGLLRRGKIDDELLEAMEEQLLMADVGLTTTANIMQQLGQKIKVGKVRDAQELYVPLKAILASMLQSVAKPLTIDQSQAPYVILMVGVNGVGKTTTIGKLAYQLQRSGQSVMLSAGDTFRAGAVEQLQIWGERHNIPVFAQSRGADSSAVIFDALQAARARHIDVLIADTAGRLHNKSHLMASLQKTVRVIKKVAPQAPHEIMLTLDATTGQNAISQLLLFHEAVGISGITLTKLDGTAKGGIIFALAEQFGIPIRYIGFGEQVDDLSPFDAGDFIEALFAPEWASQSASKTE